LEGGVRECQVYSSWATSLTGTPTVVECVPRASAGPGDVLRDVEGLVHVLEGFSADGIERRVLPAELIGGRFNVYKVVARDSRGLLYEARAVRDTRSDRIIWAGAVYRGVVGGVPRSSMFTPRLTGVEGPLDPPPSPPGQKTIRKPVIYSAEAPLQDGGETGATGEILVGPYSAEGPRPSESISMGELESRAETFQADFHCVTGWSVGRIEWSGVRLLDLLDSYNISGRWIIAVSAKGYTAVFPYDRVILENAMVVVGLNGEPLPYEHGGPVRLVIPRLYGWKSVKWLRMLLVGEEYLDGYWEARGYHWRGLIVGEERFKDYG